MINNEITSWTQPVGSEIKGDKHGDSFKMKCYTSNYVMADYKYHCHHVKYLRVSKAATI
jgi:formylmethanofuran dehydrogenase subunit C